MQETTGEECLKKEDILFDDHEVPSFLFLPSFLSFFLPSFLPFLSMTCCTILPTSFSGKGPNLRRPLGRDIYHFITSCNIHESKKNFPYIHILFIYYDTMPIITLTLVSEKASWYNMYHFHRLVFPVFL